tara:strand:- start:279 stop:656 length:378 start_codon:yes stop_codon:yes gene_type:complete
MKLTFRSNKTLRSLAEATIKHEKFKVPYENKTTTKKSFFFVKDDGIYLMNSYCDKKGDRKKVNHVVYASGYNPKTNKDVWEDSRDAVGGDDFADSIEFEKDQLDRIARGGSVSIEVHKDHWKVWA